MMKAIPRNPEVQSLAQIHDAVARATAVLKGDFGKEIEAMKQLDKQLQERQGTIDTVEKAEAVRKEADAYAIQTKSEASDLRVAAHKLNDQAQAKLSTIIAREESVGKREHELDDRMNEFEKSKIQSHSILEQKTKALTAREEGIVVKEKDLARREALLKAKEQKAQALLASLSEG